MATKKYSHIHVILYAVGLWALSFPLLAFWVSTSILDCSTASPSTGEGKKDADGEKPKFVDKSEQLKMQAEKRKKDAKKSLRAERQASLSFSQQSENEDAPVQIEWQWITKAQMITLIHEMSKQTDIYLDKVDQLKGKICYDKDTELKFDPTYKKVDELSEKEAHYKHGISRAQWRKLIKFHSKDPMIMKELKDMQNAPDERKPKEHPKISDMQMSEFMKVQKLMVEQTKEIVLQLRWTDEREDSYEFEQTQITISMMVLNRAFRQYGLTEEDLGAGAIKFKKELEQSKEYLQDLQDMAQAQSDMREAADPENWREKQNKESKENREVDDTFVEFENHE